MTAYFRSSFITQRVAENEGDIRFVMMWHLAGFHSVIRYCRTARLSGDRREINDEVIPIVAFSGPLRRVKHREAFRLLLLTITLPRSFTNLNHIGVDINSEREHDSLPGHDFVDPLIR